MIQLSTQRFLILDRNGRQRPFSPDDLQQVLLACFAACGVTDQWPAEHIAMVLEEHLRQRRQEQTGPLGEVEIDSLVASVLTATGFGDVATEYRRARRIEPVAAVSGRTSPWNEQRLAANLVHVLPLATQELQELVCAVRDALAAINLQQVSDSFIRLLGAHVLRNAPTSEGLPPDTHSPWLLTAADLAGLVGTSAARLIEEGIVRPKPVSRLIPRQRVDLDIGRFAERIGPPPLTEMAFLPNLYELCRELPGLMARLRTEICRRARHADCHPAHLMVQRLPTVVNNWLFPLNRKAANAFCLEVEAILRAEVAARVDFELLVIFT